MSIMDRINQGDFKNNKPYARRSQDPEKHAAYQAETARLEKVFRAELEAEEGEDHWPQEVKDALYSKAWDEGHSAGFSEVVCCYQDLRTLVNTVFEAGKHSVLARTT